MRTPYFRDCRQCWYIKHNGKDVRLGSDKDEAFKRWHELQREEKPADSGTMVEEVVSAFLCWVKAHQSPATYGWYCHFLAGPDPERSKRQGFTDHVGAMKLSALKPYHVYRWIEHCGYTQSEAPVRCVLRCFKWAEDCGKIAKNPVKGLKKPTVTPAERYLHPEQWEKLLGRVKGPFRDLIVFIRLTGCRPQEARAVQARHLDGASIIFPAKESKGKKRQRVIRLNDQALAIVRRLALKSPEGPIFRNDDGDPWSRNALVCRFQRLTEKLGFYVCAYSLRSTYITDALVAGVDPVTLARLVGHANLDMIQSIYAKVQMRADHMKAAAEKAVAGVA